MDPSSQKKPSNGTISERTKIPLSLAIPLVLFVIGFATATADVYNRLRHFERHVVEAQDLLSERTIGDRFRGADMDRWVERVQWAWSEFSPKRYPRVPPWRCGKTYIPETLTDEQKQ